MGVPFSFVHKNRLEREGKFPRRVVFGPSRKLRIRHEVVAWLRAREAARDIDLPTRAPVVREGSRPRGRPRKYPVAQHAVE